MVEYVDLLVNQYRRLEVKMIRIVQVSRCDVEPPRFHHVEIGAKNNVACRRVLPQC